MHHLFLQGILFWLGFLTVMGPQNLFVLDCGLRKANVWTAASVSATCDVMLLALGAFGLGLLFLEFPLVQWCITAVGVIFLAFYGIQLLKNAAHFVSRKERFSNKNTVKKQKTFRLALSFALLNPAVYLDTLAIFGSYANRFSPINRMAFGCGAALTSVVWFTLLALCSSVFAEIQITSWIVRTCRYAMGVYMLACSASLGMTLFE